MSKYVTAADRVKVFQDTLNWIKTDPVLAASVAKSKKHTTIFWEDIYPSFDKSQTRKEVIEVTPERTFQAAMRLHKEDKSAKIAVLNFANAFHAGGGVTAGASAQEECLCRCSTLYPLIYRRSLRDTFYKHHYTLNTPKASDAMIYTEGVVICKTDESYPQRMPMENWVKVDVITMAAPDLRKSSNKYAELINNGADMNDAELFGYHVKRAIHMMTVAAHKGVDVLVLGAFGCGAFENDPNVVAKAYKTALEVFPKVFEKVVFAVYCNPKNTKNYEVFKEVLGKAGKKNAVTGEPNFGATGKEKPFVSKIKKETLENLTTVKKKQAMKKLEEILLKNSGGKELSSEEIEELALKTTILQYKKTKADEWLEIMISVLRNIQIWVPCLVEMSDADKQKFLDIMDDIGEDEISFKTDKNLIFDEDVHMKPDLLSNGEALFFPVFSTIKDMGEYGDNFGKVQMPFLDAIHFVETDERPIEGIVINAYGDDFVIPKEGFDAINK